MREVEHDNPFCMDEISNLGFAREENDLEYLKDWSRKAVKFHEKHRNDERERLENGVKWTKLIAGMTDIVDRDDLVNLEFGPEDKSENPQRT